VTAIALLGGLLGSGFGPEGGGGASAAAMAAGVGAVGAAESVRLVARYVAAGALTLALLPPSSVEAEVLTLSVASNLAVLKLKVCVWGGGGGRLGGGGREGRGGGHAWLSVPSNLGWGGREG
jgi:hypothetical protein